MRRTALERLLPKSIAASDTRGFVHTRSAEALAACVRAPEESATSSGPGSP
jgi:hypothetical protein